MESVIDKLSLKINVKVKKDLDKTIGSIATAINRLNKAVSKVGALNKYISSLNQLSKEFFKIAQATVKTEIKAPKTIAPPEYQEVATTNEIKKQDAVLKSKNNRLNVALGLSRKQFAVQKKIRLEDERVKPNKKDDKKATFLSKMFASIRRVAFYRVIRATLSGIVKAAAQGLENIRSVDTELDTSMSKMSQSFTSIKNSIASFIAPLVQTLEPVITKIADSLANWSNRINEAKAALSGQTTYTKILTSDSEEYKENLKEATGELLEFDKFSSLSKDSQYTGTVESTVTMSKEEAQGTVKSLKMVEGALASIVGLVGAIFAFKIGSKIASAIKSLGGLSGAFGKVGKSLTNVFKSTKGLATVGFAALATGIISIIANWEQMGQTGKWLIPVITALATVITAIVVLIKMGTGQWVKALSIAGIVGGSVATIGSTLSAAIGFKDGGVPKQGTYFYAGEAGAEIVANTSGGKTGVTNITQFKTAMVQALAEYGVAQRGRNSDTVLQINGKEFARVTAGDMANALGQKYRVDFQPR